MRPLTRWILIALVGIATFAITSQVCRSDDDLKPGRIILPVNPVIIEPDKPRPIVDPSDPKIISEIKPDEMYVVESPIKLIVLTSPAGVLTVETTEGPIRVRGKFSDGIGAIETRNYTAPWVYFVTTVGTGKSELILIPEGVKLESDIVRQVLTVSGSGPNPPPDPDPQPDPEPDTKPVKSFRVIFVKESGQTLNAAQTAIPGAKSIRDYLAIKTTAEGGLVGWREYDPQQNTESEQAAMKALWEAVKPKLLAAPCMVIEINGHATVMPFPANVDECLSTLKKAGG